MTRQTDELDQDAIDALAHHIAAVAFEQDESVEVDMSHCSHCNETKEIELTAISGWWCRSDDGVIECVAETTVTTQKKIAPRTLDNPAAYTTIEHEVAVIVRADWTGTYPLCGDCEIDTELL